MEIRLELGDCFELIKSQPDNSVDLVITSPPYSDIVNYGKDVSIKKPKDYVIATGQAFSVREFINSSKGGIAGCVTNILSSSFIVFYIYYQI